MLMLREFKGLRGGSILLACTFYLMYGEDACGLV